MVWSMVPSITSFSLMDCDTGGGEASGRRFGCIVVVIVAPIASPASTHSDFASVSADIADEIDNAMGFCRESSASIIW